MVDTRVNIGLIITGGIAAFRSLELIRILRKNNYHVTVVLTKSALQFVTALSASILSEDRAYTDLFLENKNGDYEFWENMPHIKLAKKFSHIIIAPASYNFIASYANGLADNLALNILAASNANVFLFPSMNPTMLEKKSVKRNLRRLKKDGVHIFGAANGKMICGDIGDGRMIEPESIFSIIDNHIKTDILSNNAKKNVSNDNVIALNQKIEKPFLDKNFILTIGGTKEYIDPIRVITNRSSGLQGIEIAKEILANGGNLHLIYSNISFETYKTLHRLKKKYSKKQLKASYGETFEKMNNFVQKPCDVAIFCAAICDYQPIYRENKMKKNGSDEISINLRKLPDMSKSVATSENRPKLVIGFSAETENLVKNSKIKLQNKNLDFILANKVGKNKTFNKKKNKIIFIAKDKVEKWKKMSKKDNAKKIIEKIKIYLENESKI